MFEYASSAGDVYDCLLSAEYTSENIFLNT